MNNNSKEYKSQEPPHEFGWCLIPPAVLSADDLSLSAKVILGKLIGLVQSKGYCFATNEWLSREFHLSIRVIQRYILNLIDAGYIKREVGNGNKRRLYLTEKVLMGGGCQERHGGVSRTSWGGVRNVMPSR